MPIFTIQSTKDGKTVYINISEISTITEYIGVSGQNPTYYAVVTMQNGDKIYLNTTLALLASAISTALSSYSLDVQVISPSTISVSSMPSLAVTEQNTNRVVTSMPTVTVVQQ